MLFNTFNDFLSGEVGAASSGPLDDVGEADAEVEQLLVVVRTHGTRQQARQIHALP